MTPPRSAFGAPPLGGAAGGPAEPDPRQPPDPIHRSVALGAFALVLCMLAAPAHAANAAAAASVMPWWVWVLALFVV